MSKFNKQLKEGLLKQKVQPNLVAANSIQKPDTVNRQGHAANSLNAWVRLISMLNTLKLENQYYRSENQTVRELKDLITILAKENPYMVAQCIVYSRCIGEGMRSINHLAATLLAPYISGQEWGKRFYSKWDKKRQKGGCIFRTDDMSEIMACYKMLNNKSLPNAMKKGFASVIENSTLYEFGKYTKQIRDVANMVHPHGDLTPEIEVRESIKGMTRVTNQKVLNYIMQGYNIPAETWERAQSEAGEIVKQAQRDGKIDDNEAAKLLQEAKAENWNQLLTEGKLGILAALRNLRSILATNPTKEVVNMLVALLTDGGKLREGKIMPYQLDMANEVITVEFNSPQSRLISQALLTGYERALPNMSEILNGNNLVIIDVSGSMWMRSGILQDPNRKLRYTKYAGDKALQIGATIAKATNADVIRFGSNAEYVSYNPNTDIFTLAASWKRELGATNLASALMTPVRLRAAFIVAQKSGRKYDRIFILSDNECNRGDNATAYKNYVASIGNPYIYSIDLAAYGTTVLAGPKVRHYFGFGYSMFDDITKSEFNAESHLVKIQSIVI